MGTPIQQDAEISSLYNEAILNYGNGRVLGILATNNDEHYIDKREADTSTTPLPSVSTTTAETSLSTTPSTDDNTGNTTCEDCLYHFKSKAILHTKSPPELQVFKEFVNGTNNHTEWRSTNTSLTSYTFIGYDTYLKSRPYDRFIIRFSLADKEKVRITFISIVLNLDIE